jgi:hypothetical protein
MRYLKIWEFFEVEEKPKLKFIKNPRKKGSKTDVYDVVKDGFSIGQIK